MTNKERRQFLTTGVLGGAGSWFHLHVVHADTPRVLSTPEEIEGPFYLITPQKDKDFDLTHVAGRRISSQCHSRSNGILISGWRTFRRLF